MNAPNPTSGERDLDALRRAQRAHEPSMDEILASIRAIIADDRHGDASKPAPVPPPAPKPASNPGPQIVYSNDSPVISRPVPEAAPLPAAAPEPPPATLRGPVIDVFAARGPERKLAAPQEPEPTAPPEPEPPLLSEEADRAVADSFNALSTSVALQSAELIESMTRELLRPMIKTWLDEHLPSMVERLVRAEIQRVARGGR
jgi:cell pole-organizing protein PopZ